MTTATVIRQAPAAAVLTAAGEIDGQLVPWNTPAALADRPGGPVYREQWAPGSLTPSPDGVPVYAAHRHTVTGELERGELIGRVAALEDRPDGLYGTVSLVGTTAAQDLRTLAREFPAFLSIEAVFEADREPAAGELVTRSQAELTGLAVILPPHKPAFPTAAVTAVRTGETTTMTDTPIEPEVPDDDDTDDDDETTGPDTEPTDAVVVGRSAVAELVRSEVARSAVPRGRIAAHPLAKYPRFVDAFDAAYADRTGELATTIGRALADQISPNNPGVVPPGWVTDVKGIVELGRRTIAALGPNPDTGEGLELNWPYFDGNLLALVGVQAAEKTAITSVRVDLKKGTAPLAVYAGGSDLSLVLINRSSPAYRDAYLRIMAAAYAAVTDKAATDQLEVASNAAVIYDLATDTDGAAFRAAVFEASVMVEDATGQPASVILAATDVFVKIGSVMTPAPVVNVGGTADAASLSVDVSQLAVTRAPALAPGTALVTNQAAAAWAEDGPQTINALDVEKLGENIALWGMGGLVTYYPAGVVTLNPTGIAALEAGGTKRGSK